MRILVFENYQRCPVPLSITYLYTSIAFPFITMYVHVICCFQWLRKQAEARRIPEIDDPDLSEEEKNPVWLKDKGE